MALPAVSCEIYSLEEIISCMEDQRCVLPGFEVSGESGWITSEAPGKGLSPLRPRHRAGPAAQGLHLPPLQAGWSTGHARSFAAAEFSGRVRCRCRVRYLTPGRAFAPYGILTDQYSISNRDSHPPLAAHRLKFLRCGAFRETATTSGPLSQQKFGGSVTGRQRENCAHLNVILQCLEKNA